MSAAIRLLAAGLITAVAVLLEPVTPARADDGGSVVVIPGDDRGVVDTQVTAPGRPGAAAAQPPAGQSGRTVVVTCRYYRTFYDMSTPGGRRVDLGGPVRTSQGVGQWWLRLCSDWSRDLVFVPAGADPNAAPAVVTPAVLALRAYNELRLPRPVVGFSPARPTSAGPATTVNVATWWWVRDWSVLVQRTVAGPVWAVVTARPVRSVWTPGDGGPQVSCGGPGQAWAPGAGSASGCSSVYHASSAGEPGSAYQASVTVAWQVSWVGAGGTGGVLPTLRITTGFAVAVMERESVVLGGGGAG